MKKKPVAILSFLTLSTLFISGCSGIFPPDNSSEDSSIETSSVIPLEDNKVHIIVLAGQSGARGKGVKNELTSDQLEENQYVRLYQDGHEMAYIERLDEEVSGDLNVFCGPGFGDSNSEIGPEIGIAETFSSRYHGEEDFKAVIVKYTVCGSDFPNEWYSTSMINDVEISPKLNKDAKHLKTFNDKQTGPLTRDLYQLLSNCIKDLKDAGCEPVIDGLAWSHGEMDAQKTSYTAMYEKNLKYFINDFRTEFGADIPVVVSSILTNCAGYRNEVLKAQQNVASSVNNVTLIDTSDLFSNSFEPWHLSAQSNVILGNEMAAALLEKLDDRKIESLNLPSKFGGAYKVPHGYEVKLPQYLPFNYKDDFTGYSKVTYTSTYDKNTVGDQEVSFVVKNVNGALYEGKLPVKIVDNPFVDGKVDETTLYHALNQTCDDKVQLYYASDESGLYLAGKVTDTHIWSDSVNYSRSGDFNQMNRNDDMRFFITGNTASERRTICLSAANLFRFYKTGVKLYENINSNNNLFYKRTLEGDVNYRVTFNGKANDNSVTSEGWEFEIYVSYEDLGVTGLNQIKLCAYHSDIQNPDDIAGGTGSAARTGAPGSETYIIKTAVSDDHPEENINAYFSLS